MPEQSTKNFAFGISLTTLFLLLCTAQLTAAGFASKILRIDSGNFPAIEVTLKVFSSTPTTFSTDNFLVKEEQTSVASFSVHAQKPTQYIMVALDRSSSIKAQMPQVKQAAAAFINSMPARVKAGIISFGSDVQIEQSCTDDRNALLKAIQKIRPYGGTSLYDVVFRGCHLLSRLGKRTDLKTMVVLTDGYDRNPRGTGPMSIKTINEAISIAEKNKIKVFTIGLGNEIDKNVMHSLAQKTGGTFLPAKDTQQLRVIYQKLGQRLELEQYIGLSYTSPKPEADGTLRQVSIESQWQGIKNQGSESYRAPLPPPPEPEVVKETASELKIFSGTELNEDLLTEELLDQDFYSHISEPGIKSAMQILVESANTQLKSIYRQANSTLGPIVQQWNADLADKSVNSLPDLRNRAITTVEIFEQQFADILGQFEPAAYEIANAFPEARERKSRANSIKNRLFLLRHGVHARVFLLKHKFKTNAFLNIHEKKTTDFQNKYQKIETLD